jgi:predicted transcriptional regulator
MNTLDQIRADLDNEIDGLARAARRRKKLNATAVMQARVMFAAGYTKAAIARELGCTPQNIGYVVSRKTWKNV